MMVLKAMMDVVAPAGWRSGRAAATRAQPGACMRMYACTDGIEWSTESIVRRSQFSRRSRFGGEAQTYRRQAQQQRPSQQPAALGPQFHSRSPPRCGRCVGPGGWCRCPCLQRHDGRRRHSSATFFGILLFVLLLPGYPPPPPRLWVAAHKSASCRDPPHPLDGAV